MFAGWLITAALRAAQGSATVAILTSAGLLADAAAGQSDMFRVLLTISIGFGGLGFSHINDSFFWILTRYLGISVGLSATNVTQYQSINLPPSHRSKRSKQICLL